MQEQTTSTPTGHGDRAGRATTTETILHYAVQQWFKDHPEDIENDTLAPWLDLCERVAEDHLLVVTGEDRHAG